MLCAKFADGAVAGRWRARKRAGNPDRLAAGLRTRRAPFGVPCRQLRASNSLVRYWLYRKLATSALDTRPREVSAVKTHVVSQLSDSALLHELAAVVARDRVTTAEKIGRASCRERV